MTLERCNVSTVNTTRSTSRHFKMLPTRLTGWLLPPFLSSVSHHLFFIFRHNSAPLLTAMSFFCLSSALLTKAYQTAAVLFEVLKAVNVSQSVEVDQAVLDFTSFLLCSPSSFISLLFHAFFANCNFSSSLSNALFL